MIITRGGYSACPSLSSVFCRSYCYTLYFPDTLLMGCLQATSTCVPRTPAPWSGTSVLADVTGIVRVVRNDAAFLRSSWTFSSKGAVHNLQSQKLEVVCCFISPIENWFTYYETSPFIVKGCMTTIKLSIERTFIVSYLLQHGTSDFTNCLLLSDRLEQKQRIIIGDIFKITMKACRVLYVIGAIHRIMYMKRQR